MLFGYLVFVTLILQLHIPVINPCRIDCCLCLNKTCKLVLSSFLRKETKDNFQKVFLSVVTLIGTLIESSAA